MYNKIMVPLDGSKLAECVLPHLEFVVRGCEMTNVFFVRVAVPPHIPHGPHTDGASIYTEKEASAAQKQLDKTEKTEAERYLNEFTSRLTFSNATLKTEVLVGIAADSLADFAAKNEIDLIIMSTHGRSGISRWVMGSTADRVLRSSCVPVMMIRAPGCVPGI
jgi:nucleotide-binding universal stress UspA family protein